MDFPMIGNRKKTLIILTNTCKNELFGRSYLKSKHNVQLLLQGNFSSISKAGD